MNVIAANTTHTKYLSDFGAKSFIDAYQSTLPLEALRDYVNEAFSEPGIRKEIEDALAAYFIFLDSDSNPCGYAKLVQSPAPESIGQDSNIELQRLYVDSTCRGQGAGRLLHSRAETHAASQNIHIMWLRVWEGNVAARDIYKNWGYVIVGNEPYEVGKEKRTVLVMRKLLI